MADIKLFETLIDESLQNHLKSLSEENIHFEKLEPHMSSTYFATYIEHVINHAFRHLKSDDSDIEKQREISNQIIELISNLVQDKDIIKMKIVEEALLKGITSPSISKQKFIEMIPQTSIVKSSLFTGNVHEPLVYSELKKEIATADRIDLLVSFIKHSGLRLIYDDLVEHTKNKTLRVITTSYMGASDYKAIRLLSELPNTEVKISYDTERTRLHAKAYYFERDSGFSTAYIGSSNLSKAALSEGTEWNLKITSYLSPEIIQKYLITFETYWNTPEFVTFCPNNLDDVKKLKNALSYNGNVMNDSYFFDLTPFAYQQEILDRLEIERVVLGSFKNLIVAATGTGKTMISAFDFKRFIAENPNARLLFLAHREEILKQSISSFRGVLRDANFGELWVSQHKPSIHQHIFASIQTLNSNNQYEIYEKSYFDYIVLDETHHVAAKSYKRILDHFEPKIFLGLTATPERLDGENILEDFNHHIAYEIRLGEAIRRNLLCPFHYFAVTDATDLSQVLWRNGMYDTEALNTKYIGNIIRDNAIIQAIDKYLPDLESTKGLGFCASVEHAEYMANCFNDRGIPSVNLDAKSNREMRNSVQEQLKKGDIKFIFVVDLYNEGVDIPEVNTLLFLRPTESPTIFTQQLGRGLRLHPSKSVLTVLDFIGQAHKQYDYRLKLQCLVGRTSNSITQEIEADFPSLSRNCIIQFERVAREIILENLRQNYSHLNRFRKLIIQYNQVSSNKLTVGNFLDYYDISPASMYKTTTLESLCLESSVAYSILDEMDKGFLTKVQKQNFLYKLAQSSALTWLKNISEFIKSGQWDYGDSREASLLMLFYLLPVQCTNGASNNFDSVETYLKDLFLKEPTFKRETLEVIDYKIQKINHLPKKIGQSHLSLELHAEYSVDQVLAIFGEHTYTHKKAFREGVLYVRSENTDIFFITLNKSEKQFSETTMYEDYAINDRLFHWQSQSRTTVVSNTGQRYINCDSKVMLFVRNKKIDSHGKTAVYTCLGYAKYVMHKGSAPISITYALEERMPMEVFRNSNPLVDII